MLNLRFWRWKFPLSETEEKLLWVKETEAKLAADSNNPQSYYDLASAKDTLGAPKQEVKRLLQKVLTLNSRFYRALDYLALLEDDDTKAIALYEESLQIEPSRWLIHLLIARRWQKLKDTNEFTKHLERTLELNPSCTEAQEELKQLE